MQIIIPMSGFGERFRRNGYKIPKPLIKVEGLPIIGHVINLFPGETKFIFICNQEHLDNKSFEMEKIIRQYSPKAIIKGISPHKLGPVNAIIKARELIDLSDEVVVNYCDFSCYWNWENFKLFIKKKSPHGVIPAYRGFHPHSLGTTNYAYLKEENGILKDIQEKKPFTENKMEEYASSGTYYFESGKLLLESLDFALEKNLNTNGEFYLSMAYKNLLSQKKKIFIYPLQHFMQWGTPDDLNEYNYWSNIFNLLVSDNMIQMQYKYKGVVLVPMAGYGQRFVNEDYDLPKPLIKVSNEIMAIQSVRDLPRSKNYIFSMRKNMRGFKYLSENLKKNFKNTYIIALDKPTKGQACTVFESINKLPQTNKINLNPLTIGACDNGAIYSKYILDKLIKEPNVDIIVWGIRNHFHAIKNPEMYGWIDADKDGLIKNISVKKPISDKLNEPIVTGTFIFKESVFFESSYKKMIERQGTINNEYYVDSCINDAIAIGLKCHLFIVDAYLSWGTPNDLRTFNYWQSLFSKWKYHNYSLRFDKRIKKQNIKLLEKQYKSFEI